MSSLDSAPSYFPPLYCRSAYATETRSIILSLDRVSKVAPNGKQILKNVGLGMYLGAKIGVLGQNGASTKPKGTATFTPPHAARLINHLQRQATNL